MPKLKWESQRSRLGFVVNDPASYRLVDPAGDIHGQVTRAGGGWQGIDKAGSKVGTFADLSKAKEAVHRRAHQA